MKYTLLLIFLLLAFNSSASVDEYRKYIEKMNALIIEGKYEEAAEFSANRFNKPVYKSYDFLAYLIRKNQNISNREAIADKYLRKGCLAGDYHACRSEADLLRESGRFEEAEKIYIELASKYPDPHSAGKLASMYHNRKWAGFNPEKAKYWQLQIPNLDKRAKEESNN